MDHVQSYPVKDYKEWRERFLNEVSLEDGYSIYGDYDITHDFHPLSNRIEKKSQLFQRYFLEMVAPALDQYCKSWGCEDWGIVTAWVHKYETGGEYIHHTHTLCNMAGVVHLLLDDEKDHTYIEYYSKPIKEGEVVLLPSMHPHSCKPVNAKKIVISFNWNMHGDMKQYASPRIKQSEKKNEQ